MALIIEDGTGVADANSYVTVEEAQEFALARGVILPAGDADVEPLLIRAMDYLEAQRSRYQGAKTLPGVQLLQWPRTGVVIDCNYSFPDNVIPEELKRAQMLLSMESFAGIALMPYSDGRVVKSKKVDVIQTEYFSAMELGLAGAMGPTFPAVEALLAPLFVACGGSFRLKTVRV